MGSLPLLGLLHGQSAVAKAPLQRGDWLRPARKGSEHLLAWPLAALARGCRGNARPRPGHRGSAHSQRGDACRLRRGSGDDANREEEELGHSF
ncbi:hypothetical protein GW17_00060083 [Ensete ventricosum]|nr:hypothetical protein GW17_00060083 [Ensete ventricosum]